MLDNLTSLSFEMRRLDLKIRRIQSALHAAEGDDREEEQINLDEAIWQKASAEQVAHDRVREILQWEMLKKEQVKADPTFDTTDPNTHQMESLYKSLQNRKATLGTNSSQPEILNVLGPLATIERLSPTLMVLK